MPKIVIAGGTGFIGTYLKKEFLSAGWEVAIISRQNGDLQWNKNQEIIAALNTADILLNLAGKNINCRHNNDNKKEILASRIDATHTLGKLIAKCTTPPALWLNASSMGIYKTSYNQVATEASTNFSTDFLSIVSQEWEKAFFSCQVPHTKQIALRISIVLGKNGGAFPQLYRLTKFGLGGTQGSGKQIMSWIHIDDFFRAILFIQKQKETLPNIINLATPNAVSNDEFMRKLRNAANVPIGLPAATWMIKTGAFIIGTEAEILLASNWVYPQILTANGFSFLFPTLDTAFSDLLR